MKGLNVFEKLVFFFNSIAATVLLLSYALPFIPPKTFSLISVLSLGVPFLILVNVCFFVYWLLKVKRQFLLSLVVLAIGYWSFGSLYKFSKTKTVSDAANLSVMSYNVRLFNLYNWIKDKGIETKIESLIADASPDILCLQEYHPHDNVNLSFPYKFEKLSGRKTKYGQAIFSKYKIINSGSVAFPNTSNNAIYADIVRAKDTLRVYNVHLQSLHIDPKVEQLNTEDSEKLYRSIGKTFDMQHQQAELFLKHKAKSPYKTIVCGDFNNTAFSYVYNAIKGDMQDAFKEAGNGFGSTYDFKFFPTRIDFIFADKSFTVNHFKTFNERLSDHYPVFAEVVF